MRTSIKKTSAIGVVVISAVWLCSCIKETPEQTQDAQRWFPIVSNGKACVVIVTPDAPLPVVKYAADELQSHIEQATGIRLAIILEKEAVSNITGHIYLGSCVAAEKAGVNTADMKANNFRVKITPNALFLAGKDEAGAPVADWKATPRVTPSMGTLFAVYDWLDRQVGVKWLWPGKLGTFVPHHFILTSGKEQDRKVVYPFINAGYYLEQYLHIDWKGVVNESVQKQFVDDSNAWACRHRFAQPVNLCYGHAYEQYWKRFGKTHPEFFAMRPDGKREPLDGNVHLVQMCVSNPDLHKQIIADWLEQRKKDPSRPWINGCENDKRKEDPSCVCEQCRAWDPKNPEAASENPYAVAGSNKTEAVTISLSDRYCKFWLALQAEGRKYDPEATVAGYAYSVYAKPPLETRLNDHIPIWIVPATFFPMSARTEQAVLRQWDGWAKTGAGLILRPNYFLNGWCMPYIYARQFGKQFKHAFNNGMIGTQIYPISMWGVQGPNLYMIGRLHARPDLSVEEVLGEYYSGFGPAAKHVRTYFEYWEGVTKECSADFYKTHHVNWGTFYRAADKIYTPEKLAEGFEMLDAAARAAEQDPEASARVEFLKKGLKHAELAIRTTMAFQALQKNPEDKNLLAAYHKALNELDAYRRTIANDHVVSIPWLTWMENLTWDRMQVQMMAKYEKLAPLPLFWSFQWDPKEIGRTGKWYAEDFNASNWLRVRTDKWWEDQDVGEKWKQAHGKDYDGLAWYRTTFTVPAGAKGRKIYLLFGAVDEGAVIWVNGQQVLDRKYNVNVDPDAWEKSFTVDITSVVRFDAPNVVAVQVEDRSGKGGIWRSVAVVGE